jgi:aspartate/glutamate racemase
MDRMKAEKQVDSMMLTGTELPLILCQPVPDGIPIIDTMSVHAAAAVDEMFRK